MEYKNNTKQALDKSKEKLTPTQKAEAIKKAFMALGKAK